MSRSQVQNDLMSAIRNNSLGGVIDALNRGADPNVKEFLGFTSLMIASLEKKPDIVRILLIAGADPQAETMNGMKARDFADEEIEKILDTFEKERQIIGVAHLLNDRYNFHDFGVVEDLNEYTREAAIKHKQICSSKGVELLIYCTLRSNQEQNELYAHGRTVSGTIITNAKAGQSFHNWRVAFDFVPVVNGKAMWNDNALFIKCGEIAEGVGLEWAGRWKKFNEMPHCQYTGGLSLADFQAGKTL